MTALLSPLRIDPGDALLAVLFALAVYKLVPKKPKL